MRSRSRSPHALLLCSRSGEAANGISHGKLKNWSTCATSHPKALEDGPSWRQRLLTISYQSSLHAAQDPRHRSPLSFNPLVDIKPSQPVKRINSVPDFHIDGSPGSWNYWSLIWWATFYLVRVSNICSSLSRDWHKEKTLDGAIILLIKSHSTHFLSHLGDFSL